MENSIHVLLLDMKDIVKAVPLATLSLKEGYFSGSDADIVDDAIIKSAEHGNGPALEIILDAREAAATLVHDPAISTAVDSLGSAFINASTKTIFERVRAAKDNNADTVDLTDISGRNQYLQKLGFVTPKP